VSSTFVYINQAGIRSGKQPILGNEDRVSCSKKQREPFIGFELATGR